MTATPVGFPGGTFTFNSVRSGSPRSSTSPASDCENAAAKRWLAAHGRRYAELGAVFLGDDLFSRQPLCEAVREVGGSFIFVCKPASHALIQEYIAGAELPTLDVPVKRGTPMTNLFVSLLDRLGVKAERIGDSTGRLDEV